MFARKRFGQHFLHDRSVLDRIVQELDPRADDALLEIGPGRGALTERLLGRSRSLDAVEIDRDLAALLRQRFGTGAGFELHEADALEFDLEALARRRGTRLRVIGNLPYNISTPLLFHVAAAHEHITDLHVMLQKEVIDRIVAAPGSGDYGRLTVMLAPWFEARHLFDVGPGAFTPAPRVWSAVARLTVRREPAFEVPQAFARTVSAAFSQRRKTLRNAVRSLMDISAITAAGIDPGVRPETLSPAQFAALAAHVADK
ncbi:MAG TPA: 16S rRNA (adenine(1518)-N(6)/adenine(1519)-N(6))-dimethyltransferase RsmA [Steroidobacteraceae bacterium]|jgi:16S rRNA (adenine1518-N6/adenine1519-N6)-dimethyltransferase|nr:16S rRNA (adenine(1518)-N(6)/adenine(1519)-N(6))-dimethyltransferase RsmA [Steroidobacteraceae bacterium]